MKTYFSTLILFASIISIAFAQNYGANFNPRQPEDLHIKLPNADLVICDAPIVSIHDRINNRTYPTVFSAWGGVDWSPVVNLDQKPDEYQSIQDDLYQITLHDLLFSIRIFWDAFKYTETGITLVGNNETYWFNGKTLYNAKRKQNPNMLFLDTIKMREASLIDYGKDWEHWIRLEDGTIAEGWGNSKFMDFTHPDVQRLIIDQTVAVANCGYYEGVIFGWWNEDGVILADGKNAKWGNTEASGFRGYQAEQDARDNILKEIREQVRDDFLIIGNTNRRTIPRTAWAINGAFMETLRDNKQGYTHKGITQIETSLRWHVQNLREPRITLLEGWGIPTEAPDSPANLKWMRLFTTMSLTHSDGYVLYTTGNNHEHYWYEFWDAELGTPVSAVSQLHQEIDGLFIREFTNGWAVYNRSGAEQKAHLPTLAKGVYTKTITAIHTLPDLDGEIYLKVKQGDVNGDNIVNILDLVIVANAFGKEIPDLNGDSRVNILDLVVVANHFGD